MTDLLLTRVLSALGIDPNGQTDDAIVAEAADMAVDVRNLANCHEDFARAIQQRDLAYAGIVEKITVTDQDVVVVSGWDDDAIAAFGMWMARRHDPVAHPSQQGLPAILSLRDGESFTRYSEERMRAHGWVRQP